LIVVVDRRQRLLDEIADEFEETRGWTGRAAMGQRVRAAMAKVPREAFVAPTQENSAYINAPLPIGHGQTISQPFIVAIMTELLDLEPDDVVLEIGTGSGYQAAVLAELAKQVYSIETIPELAERARERLARHGYRNVAVKTGDGAKGWAEHAPFDAIIVTAAAAEIPPALLAQLKPGGRMVIPVESKNGGGWFAHQMLVVVDKDAAGVATRRDVLPVAFVPLT
jgi:protein-L-isoaspartate(D-aspartate) O-methyltransferase